MCTELLQLCASHAQQAPKALAVLLQDMLTPFWCAEPTQHTAAQTQPPLPVPHITQQQRSPAARGHTAAAAGRTRESSPVPDNAARKQLHLTRTSPEPRREGTPAGADGLTAAGLACLNDLSLQADISMSCSSCRCSSACPARTSQEQDLKQTLLACACCKNCSSPVCCSSECAAHAHAHDACAGVDSEATLSGLSLTSTSGSPARPPLHGSSPLSRLFTPSSRLPQKRPRSEEEP